MKDINLFISSILAYALMGTITVFVTENIRDTQYLRQTLYDVVHHNTPQYPNPHILDKAVILSMAYVLMRWGFVDLRILATYFFAMSCMLLVRLFTFTLTQTPPPRRLNDKWRVNHCKRSVLPHLGISFSKMNESCIDNMFSGHAATLISALAIIWFFSKNMIEKIIASIVLTTSAIGVITSRMHYTSDVIIGSAFGFMSIWIVKHLIFDTK